MTPSPAAPEAYEISDTSYFDMADPEEDIQIYFIEEKLSFHSVQTFSSDSSILNSMQSLPIIASKNAKEFDLSLSNVFYSVQKSNTLDILEKISYFRIDPFTLIYL